MDHPRAGAPSELAGMLENQFQLVRLIEVQRNRSYDLDERCVNMRLASPGMSSIDSIAEGYLVRAAALDPFYATNFGIAGHDHELADLSADGIAERAEPDRSTLAALDAAEAPELREQVARTAMRERLASTWSAATPGTPPANSTWPPAGCRGCASFST